MSRKDSKKRKSKQSSASLYKGVLEITRSGVGYVIVPQLESDILVRPSDFNTAFNNDTVRVRIVSNPHKIGKLQGVITEVVERKQTEFIGQLSIHNDIAFFRPETKQAMPDFYISQGKLNNAKDGDRVVVRFVGWDKGKKPSGEVINIMDASDENDFAMREIILENGFAIGFDNEIEEETSKLPSELPEAEIKKRKDFRKVFTITIDPADAKDFDDAISFRVLKNGRYEIGVHIADVSYYVQPGMALDTEAYQRATSVYLPDRVNPMLPERISNELCSLRPNEDKFTFSAVFEVNAKAEIKDAWFGRTVIHSDHRFTYEDAQQVIENGEGTYKDEILILNNLAQRLRKKRFKKGAINFSSQEVRFQLDENGKPLGIVIKESKEAHQLIEEFMLLANRSVAELVSKVKVNKQSVPFPYRIHDTPDEEKLMPYVEFAKKFGYKFDIKSPETIAESFNAMLKEVEGKPEQLVMEQLGIRTMAKAVYTTEDIGHYGLGFEHYTHFTSPIRRYPDVMVHRVLQQVLSDKIHPDSSMEQKCVHCSERERAAMEAERAANKYKQVEYMKNFLGDEFEGVISGVASFGFWVETLEHKCEGLVSINSLFDYDDFRHVDSDYALVGRRSGRVFRMGDKVRIKVVSANLTKRQLDYEWVMTAPETRDTEPVKETVNATVVKTKRKEKKTTKEKKKKKVK